MATDYDKLAEAAKSGDYDALAEAARTQLSESAPNRAAARDSTMRQMMSPQAATQRWLRLGPYIGGAAGALAIRNPRGAGLGAEAAAGLLQMLGAYGGGAVVQGAADKLGGTMAQDYKQQAARMNAAGLQQLLLQAPASLTGIIGEGLVGLRGAMRGKAIRQAQTKYVSEEAGKYRAERQALRHELRQAGNEVRAASGNTAAAIKASPDRVTLQELADRVIQNRLQRLPPGATASPRMRRQVMKDMLQVVRDVNDTYARRVGTVQNVWDMENSQWLKQNIDALTRATREGQAAGVRAKPTDLVDAGDALRSLIEEKVPAVEELNRVTQAALKEQKPLQKRAAKMTPIRRESVRIAKGAEGVKQQVLANRSANPFQMFRGIPVRGGMATPGVSLRPGTFSEFGGKIGEGLASAPAEQTMQWTPRAFAMFMEWMKAQEEARQAAEAQADSSDARSRINF